LSSLFTSTTSSSSPSSHSHLPAFSFIHRSNPFLSTRPIGSLATESHGNDLDVRLWRGCEVGITLVKKRSVALRWFGGDERATDTVLSAVSKMYGWDSEGESEKEESEGFPAGWLLNNFARAGITWEGRERGNRGSRR